MTVERIAAIDCGTNSTRLLVAEPDDDGRGLRPVERLMRITRLGQGVDRTGSLAPEAVERTVATAGRTGGLTAQSTESPCVIAGGRPDRPN